MGGSPTVNDAAIRVGSVQVDEAAGILNAQPMYDQGLDLPPGVNAGLQVNIFTPQSGILASIHEITHGLLRVQFQEGNQIFGDMDFAGISLTGATQARIVAQFEGIASPSA
ncbi:hypothetical protein DMJ13_21025 [halophilic archaeon]|nr:hypothetical protein DMJ13_21025 [halophilic archaeon]